MTRRSAIGIFSLILFTAVIVSSGFAQQIAKIGVVDSQQVLEKSIEGKKIMAQLQEKDKKNKSELARKDEDIRTLQTKFNTQRLTLNQEALINMQSDLERKKTDRKRFAEDSDRELYEVSQRLFQRVQNELLPIIEQIGKDSNLDVIFDLGRSGAIYYSPTIDFTSEVIKRYDATKSSK